MKLQKIRTGVNFTEDKGKLAELLIEGWECIGEEYTYIDRGKTSEKKIRGWYVMEPKEGEKE